ncbi:acetyltransferase [Neobacillus mesonae]|uniref:acetyltransferase n=1 Tax=Neobacillus mesonae TaxID=1193713 RepID=UPI0020420B79|nr:acetyltransferase [Neobacillus mesonae]MCM3568220.1 acetyltransferase [Neobacillus mesonae]
MKIVVIGHGGHSKVVNDLLLAQDGLEVIGYLDDKYKEVTSENIFFGPIIYAKQLVEYANEIKFIVAIGDNKIRKKIVCDLNFPESLYITLIHNTAVISPSSNIDIGTVVMPNAVINANSKVGKHSIINTGAIIEHDCKVGDFTHVSPGAALTGAVEIGEGVSVGAGAAVIPNIRIGEWSVIGAGATVIHSIPSNCTAVGIPAVIKKVNQEGGKLLA